MIIFGSCISDGERFRQVALPTIENIKASDDLILTDDGSRGICHGYNTFIEVARSHADCEALVLLHDDVELLDKNFRAKVISAAADEHVGVVGVIGGAGLRDSQWWNSRQCVGFVHETRGPIAGASRRGEVDVVDGLLLVLSPTALHTLRFDGEDLPGFHGYDVDICLQARSKGLRVVVEAIDVLHRTKGGFGNKSEFDAAARVLTARWPSYIRPDRWAAVAKRVSRVDRALRKLARRAAQKLLHSGTPRAESRKSPATASSGPPPTCPVCVVELEIPQAPWPAVAPCPTCGCGITWPLPTVDVQSDSLFLGSYGGQRLERRATWVSEAEARLTWLQTFVPEGLLIDAGCATGEFVKVAGDAGFDAHGVEASEWAAHQATEYAGNIVVGHLRDWAALHPGSRADVISAWHVLEHIPEPLPFLVDVRGLLHDGGLFVGEVPNFASSLARHDSRSWPFALLEDHAHHFTPASLRSLFTRAGLETDVVIEMTRRPYCSLDQWLRHRNECLLKGLPWPNKDFIRFVARRAAS